MRLSFVRKRLEYFDHVMPPVISYGCQKRRSDVFGEVNKIFKF